MTLEMFFESGWVTARTLEYGAKQAKEEAMNSYNRWLRKPDFDDKGNYNEKKSAFLRGFTQAQMN